MCCGEIHDIRQGHEVVYCRCYDERKGKRSGVGLRSIHTPASRDLRKNTELPDTGSWWQARAEEESPLSGNLKAIKTFSYVGNSNTGHGVVAAVLFCVCRCPIGDTPGTVYLYCGFPSLSLVRPTLCKLIYKL